MENREVKNLISSHVSKRVRDYYNLPFDDKCKLVSAKLSTLPKYERDGILVDADYNCVLPDMLVDIIKTQASEESVKKFINTLIGIFVSGTAKNAPYFYADINEEFEDAWSEQWPEVNEHFWHDFKERSQAVRFG